MTLEYLLVDDQGSRSRVFTEQVSIPGELAFTVVDDPAQLADSMDELPKFDGAVVDFHLNTSSSSRYEPLLYENPDLFQEPVEVRTGIGVMLYLQQYAPNMTVYGMTELTHGHAQLFLSAASVWLGAEPLNVDEKISVLRNVLLNPDGENAHLQAAHAQMAGALAPFQELMDGCLKRNPSETYDWLRCYRQCNGPKPHTQLAAVMQRTLGQRPGVDPYKTYKPMMTVWQRALAKFVTAWGGDTTDWPVLDEAGVRTWEDNNPVLDYVKQGAYETFFNSKDVRAALTCYRSRSTDDEYS